MPYDHQEACAHLAAADPVLAEIIDTLPLPTIESTGDVFYDLVSCVVAQQIHYRARSVYTKKLDELLQGQWPSPALIEGLDSEAFAQKKIAGNKYRALMHLAARWQAEKMDQVNWQTCHDEEVRERLLPIKGIGLWTVEMILLYTLGRPDIFSPDDFQLKKIMILAYDLSPGPDLRQEMCAIAESWRPFRSLALRYLLAWGATQQRR